MMDTRYVRLLLVEDDAPEAELALNVLRKLGFPEPIAHATNGSEALTIVFGEPASHAGPLDHVPSLILLDLKLPIMDGFEVLHRLKSDERTRHIPVVVLTSSREVKDIRKAFALGANSYVVKPVNAEKYDHIMSTLAHYWLEINENEIYNAHDIFATT